MTHRKPQPERKSNLDDDRRTFFAKLSVGLSVVIGLLITLPGIGFVLAPVFRRKPEVWRVVGQVGQFKLGTTELVEFEDPSPLPWAGVTARTAAWLRRVDETTFIAFSVNCRHLGCPVRWVKGPELFMCPCHGGVYYKDGEVAAGPPPEGLHRYRVRVTGDQVEIKTSPIPLTITNL